MLSIARNLSRKLNLAPTLSSKFSTVAPSSRVSLVTTITDRPGTLCKFLDIFRNYDLNLTHIESKPSQKSSDGFHMYIDFDGSISDEKSSACLKEIEAAEWCMKLMVLDKKEVPWFPRTLADLDFIANRTLSAGTDLESDHPGFNDPVYRKRREYLGDIANNYRAGCETPTIEYTKEEIETWGTVYKYLDGFHKKHACKEYLAVKEKLELACGYGVDRIPQVADISKFLMKRTGFSLRPVSGLLSSRDFLNGLAFKIFFSTQYIRHHSRPLYTPEPDVCHELIGHVPMFADPDFADFSQEIGLASLGATDEEIMKLAKVYWFTVEFGQVRDPVSGDLKAYGAGILSSVGETEYSCTSEKRVEARKNGMSEDEIREKYQTVWMNEDSQVPDPKILPNDPYVMTQTDVVITKYQHVYFCADSLNDVKTQLREYCDQKMAKPFLCRYNANTGHIWVDRAVKREQYEQTAKYELGE